MVGVIALRNNFGVRLALRGKGMVHTDQDDFLKPHMECELHGNISYCRTGPERVTDIRCKGANRTVALNKYGVAEIEICTIC